LQKKKKDLCKTEKGGGHTQNGIKGKVKIEKTQRKTRPRKATAGNTNHVEVEPFGTWSGRWLHQIDWSRVWERKEFCVQKDLLGAAWKKKRPEWFEKEKRRGAPAAAHLQEKKREKNWS